MRTFIILLLTVTLLSCTSKSARADRIKQAQIMVKADSAHTIKDTPNYYFVDSITSIMYEYVSDSTDIKYTLCIKDKPMPKAFTYHSSFSMMASNKDAKEEILSYLTYLYNEKYLVPFKFE